MADEADLFVRQEAQHARARRAHAKAIIERYPGSRRPSRQRPGRRRAPRARVADFDLAYIAHLRPPSRPCSRWCSTTATSSSKGSGERVGTMLLWHFGKEIEHRSSALRIHHHVTPDQWYRIRKAPKVFGHVAGIYKLALAGFEEHVPFEDRHISTQGRWSGGAGPLGDARSLRLRPTRACPSMLSHVPGRTCGTILWRETKAQMPRHDPAREPRPWADVGTRRTTLAPTSRPTRAHDSEASTTQGSYLPGDPQMPFRANRPVASAKEAFGPGAAVPTSAH